jgi:hypothetical protein
VFEKNRSQAAHDRAVRKGSTVPASIILKFAKFLELYNPLYHDRVTIDVHHPSVSEDASVRVACIARAMGFSVDQAAAASSANDDCTDTVDMFNSLSHPSQDDVAAYGAPNSAMDAAVQVIHDVLDARENGNPDAKMETV